MAKISRGVFGLAVIIGGAAIYYWASTESGFSDDDVKAAETSIKTEYEKKPGIHVTEVNLIRVESRKLTGFAKIRIDGVDADITKSCSANMGDDRRYIWKCE